MEDESTYRVYAKRECAVVRYSGDRTRKRLKHGKDLYNTGVSKMKLRYLESPTSDVKTNRCKEVPVHFLPYPRAKKSEYGVYPALALTREVLRAQLGHPVASEGAGDNVVMCDIGIGTRGTIK